MAPNPHTPDDNPGLLGYEPGGTDELGPEVGGTDILRPKP